LCCLQIRNEQLSNIVRKVQGECEFVLKQASAAAEKQEALAAQLAKLTKSLEQTEERIKKSLQETKVRTELMVGRLTWMLARDSVVWTNPAALS
jgi:protein-arginine kinase activator protein McsA